MTESGGGFGGKSLMTVNRLLSIVLFVLVVAGNVRRPVMEALWPSRWESRAAGTPYGLSKWPLRFKGDPMPQQMIAFFENVERVTPPAATIAVLLPRPWNDPGVGYSHFRMLYLLAGHPIVIASGINDSEVNAAPYVASWHPASTPPRGSVVFNGHEGTLICRSSR
jgi:hypothetical protein